MPRTPQDVTDAELTLLRQLWDGGPATIRQLTDSLYPGGGTTQYATVQKLLDRLESKGYVKRDRRANVHMFSASVGRDDLIGRRIQALADKLCEGSLTAVLTHLVRAQPLSAAERKSLRELIDRLEHESPRRRRQHTGSRLMAALFDQIAFNSVAASVLGLFAFGSRWLHRPALTHFLWIIVLVRLVMPPVWAIPLPASAMSNALAESGAGSEFVIQNRLIADLELSPPDPAQLEGEKTNAIDAPRLDGSATIDVNEGGALVSSYSAPYEERAGGVIGIPWKLFALIASSTVSLAYFFPLAVRMVRFRLAIRLAQLPNRRIRYLVETLARRLGIRPPRTIMVVSRVSPCVGAFPFRPTLLLPAGLLNGLTRLQRAAILVHELAHLRRRDHWVRWLETFITGLFWWHPVVWLARHQMRAAEEICCDQWVVRVLPAARGAYARALVDTMEFLTCDRPAVVPLASGLGQKSELERRITMILRDRPVARPGKVGALLALGLGLMLPLGMARSDEPEEPPPPPRPPATPRADDDPTPRAERLDRECAAMERARAAEDRARAAEKRVRDEVDGKMRRVEIEQLRAQMESAKAQMMELQMVMEKCRRRLAELGDEGERDRAPQRNKRESTEADLEKKIRELKVKQVELRDKFGDSHPALKEVEQQIEAIKAYRHAVGEATPRWKEDTTPEPPRPPRGPRAATTPLAPVPPTITTPAQPSNPPRLAQPGGPPPRGAGPGSGEGADDPRFEMLAKQLEALRRELAEMRRDRDRPRDKQPAERP